MSGGWAAKELTEKGLKTLVLERGRNVRHVLDYSTALQGSMAAAAQQPCPPMRTARRSPSSPLFISTTSRPSSSWSTIRSIHTGQAQPFNWYQRLPGGRPFSALGAARVPLSDLDFEAEPESRAWASTGRFDMRISRPGTTTWSASSAPAVRIPACHSFPKQILQPPFEMTALEKHIKSEFAKAFTDRMLICSSIAVLSRELNGRGPCQGRNQCARGCPYSAYFSSNGVTLPAAAATGNLTLKPDSVVHSLIYDDAEATRHRRARDRCQQPLPPHRVLRKSRVPVCLGAELHHHPAEHAQRPFSRTASATTAASSVTT